MYPRIDEKALDHACKVLQAGGLVAIPTETVYGLAADADNREAVLNTFAVKSRPTNHPLIVHVASVEALPFWASVVPQQALDLARAFWPGPLTMVLPKAERCGSFVTGGQDSVAVRCPSHPWTHALLERFAGKGHKGLTAPSANTFGRISPTCAAHVREDLGVKPLGKLDYILDGGTCEVGVESTIINLSGSRPEILRHGAVTRAMLEEVLGCQVPEGIRSSLALKSSARSPQPSWRALTRERLTPMRFCSCPRPTRLRAMRISSTRRCISSTKRTARAFSSKSLRRRPTGRLSTTDSGARPQTRTPDADLIMVFDT